jgi:hypothetical protein
MPEVSSSDLVRPSQAERGVGADPFLLAPVIPLLLSRLGSLGPTPRNSCAEPSQPGRERSIGRVLPLGAGHT